MDYSAATLKGKTAIVTGGSRGLGAAMAQALLAAGASVLVADISPDTETQQHDQNTGRITTVKADISVPDDVQMVVESCLEIYGSIDILVNNAGILMREVRKKVGKEGQIGFWEVDVETFRWFLDVHVIGSFLMSKAVLPTMTKRGSGRILTVTTSFPTMQGKGRTPYGPAKACMEALAAVMAKDLEGTGITVNVVIPGQAVTSTDDAIDDSHDLRDSDGRRIVPRNPPEIMGPPVVWLASDAANDVTGMRIISNRWDINVDPFLALQKAGTEIGWRS